MSRDQQICSSLEEKLQVYAELSALSGRTDTSAAEQRLLVQLHSEEPPQAAVLLAAALQEGEIVYTRCSARCRSKHRHTAQCCLFFVCVIDNKNRGLQDFTIKLNKYMKHLCGDTNPHIAFISTVKA